MKLLKSKLELKDKPPFIFWIIFGIIVLLSGIAIWGKWGFNYKIIDIPTNVNNPVNGRNYCQKDSDCELVSQGQGFCPGCGVAGAVNIETASREEDSINIKKFICPTYKCATFVNKQAVCEQNRCVAKEKLITDQSIFNGLQFLVRPEKTSYQYKKDKPITIHGEFKNITNKNIYFYTPESSPTVTYEVFDTKRKKVEVLYFIADLGLPEKKDFVLIKPDESFTKTFKLYLGIEEDIFTPGIYSIAVIYNIWQTKYIENGEFIDLNGWSGKLKSNFIELDIKSGNKNLNQPTSKNFKIIGSLTSPGESSFVKAVGNTAYLTDISEGLLAIDVSNPEKPTLLDKIKIAGGGAYALAVNSIGLFAAVSGYGNSKVALIDIGDPKNLRIISEIDAKRTVQDMVVAGEYVYLAIDGPEVEILTLKFEDLLEPSFRPETITSKGIFKILGGGHAIGLALPNLDRGELPYLLIAQGETGIGFYERLMSGMPEVLSSLNIGYVNIVAADENYVYAGVGNAIKVIDLKTQKEIADIKVDDIWNFKVKNNTLYVASGEKGVQVLDISDIRNPKQIALIDTPGRARSVDVSTDGKYIYVADDRDDLQIIKKD